jgi:hypothetical protein
MLKSDKFIDKEKGTENVLNFIKNQVKSQKNASFVNNDSAPENRRTWYLDTRQHTLNNKHFFLLRVRKEPEEYDITIKCRHPNRYLSASYDFSKPVDIPELKFKKNKLKFEEDILQPFLSKFSNSAKFSSELEHEPNLNNFQLIQSIYPSLSNLLDIPANEVLLKVNEFEAREISYEMGKITYSDENGFKGEVETEINFWYLSEEEKAPIIVELVFNHEANGKDTYNKMVLEEFTPELIKNVNELFLSLQKPSIGIVDDSKEVKTKTEYAYGYRPS